MTITTFDPLIVSSHAADAIKVFESLGFEKTHAPIATTETGDVSTVRMKYATGFHVDVAQVDSFAQDMTMIRMNVDDFEAAYNILKEHGFTNTRGDDTLDAKSSKATMLFSPFGFPISISQHIHKEDS